MKNFLQRADRNRVDDAALRESIVANAVKARVLRVLHESHAGLHTKHHVDVAIDA
jgi:hypothetical protein